MTDPKYSASLTRLMLEATMTGLVLGFSIGLFTGALAMLAFVRGLI